MSTCCTVRKYWDRDGLIALLSHKEDINDGVGCTELIKVLRHMDKHDIVYVLINMLHGKVEMATQNDSEAWAFNWDMKGIRIQVFMNMNLIASIERTVSALD